MTEKQKKRMKILQNCKWIDATMYMPAIGETIFIKKYAKKRDSIDKTIAIGSELSSEYLKKAEYWMYPPVFDSDDNEWIDINIALPPANIYVAAVYNNKIGNVTTIARVFPFNADSYLAPCDEGKKSPIFVQAQENEVNLWHVKYWRHLK